MVVARLQPMQAAWRFFSFPVNGSFYKLDLTRPFIFGIIYRFKHRSALALATDRIAGMNER
jgi:hypothetical protein